MKYTVQTASKATGVSSARLRTWERRYGVPRPGRSDTGRRLYDEDDLAVIRRMASLVDSGVTAAQAAEAALSEAEGGTVIELPPAAAPEVHELAFALADASEQYDEPELVAAVRQGVDTLGWRQALRDVLFPSLSLIGERWMRGELALSAEHFASGIVRRELLAAVAALPWPTADEPTVVLACPEDERHDLGLSAFWLVLREAGLRVVFLGADVPAAELLSALRRTDADAVLLSATAPTTPPVMGLTVRALVAARVRARIFVGGPAFDHVRELPVIAAVRLPGAIDDAADVVIEALTRSPSETLPAADAPIPFAPGIVQVD